mmetsp:Transcript_130844/g.240555  ORF Transcript_130844/g.240555 Transcript_130844/m.240555 type:complete len:83 (-) Transcript_130844:41-289(-)
MPDLAAIWLSIDRLCCLDLKKSGVRMSEPSKKGESHPMIQMPDLAATWLSIDKLYCLDFKQSDGVRLSQPSKKRVKASLPMI